MHGSSDVPYQRFLRRNRAIARATDAILAGVGEFSSVRSSDDFGKAVAGVRAEAAQTAKAGGTLRELIESRLLPGRLDPASLRRFSLVCRAAEVSLGQTPWHHQVVTALLLNRGLIVQVPNGAGKTLAIALAAAFTALSGNGVHIVTSNDYLAERDARWMGPLYQLLGLSTGVLFTSQSVRFDCGLLDADGATLRAAPKDEVPSALSKAAVLAGGEDATAAAPGQMGERQLTVQFVFEDALAAQSDVLNGARRQLDHDPALRDSILEMIRAVVADLVERLCPPFRLERWDLRTLRSQLIEEFGLDLDLSGFLSLTPEEIVASIYERLCRQYEEKERLVGTMAMPEIERQIMLHVLDTQWRNHVRRLEELALDIGQRPEGPEDPVAEFRREAQELFDALWNRFRLETLRYLFFLHVQEDNAASEAAASPSLPAASPSLPTASPSLPAAKVETGVPVPSEAETAPSALSAAGGPVAGRPDSGPLPHETKLAYRTDKSLTRKDVLKADVVYSRIDGFSFAYLNDHLVTAKDELALTKRDFLIVDECDSVLLDDLRVPAQIGRKRDSGSLSPRMLQTLHRIAQRLRPGRDFTLHGQSARLTFEGLETLRRIGERDFFTPEASGLAQGIIKAIEALYAYKRDEDYVLVDTDIVLIEQASGRLLFGRTFSGGLHEAIQVKEGLAMGDWRDTEPIAKITTKHFVRTYLTVCGTSGAVGIPEEYRQFYGLEVVELEPYPRTRRDHPDRVFRTRREVVPYGVVPAAVEASKRGQAVLINVPQLKDIAEVADALKRANVPFQALDAVTARTLGEEAEKVARAGTAGLVTISSKIAARGTDIVLDPVALKAGGLFVIGISRETNRRYDDQLCGRAGRHGDSGDSLFVLSLEDEVLQVFGGQTIQSLMLKLGMEEGVPIESDLISRRINVAQRLVQRQNRANRSSVVEFDDILDRHRTVVYRVRQKILAEEDLTQEVNAMVENWVAAQRAAILKDGIAVGWSNSGAAAVLGPLGERLEKNELDRVAQVRNRKVQVKMIHEALARRMTAALRALGADGSTAGDLLRGIILNRMDQHWRRYLWMEHIARDEVSLYASSDPTGVARYAELMEQRFDTFFHDLGQEILGDVFDLGVESATEGARR